MLVVEQTKYEALRERAKTKKDGIYTLKNHWYLVIDNQIAGYYDYAGNVYEVVYGFHVNKGKAKNRTEAHEILKSYLVQLKK